MGITGGTSQTISLAALSTDEQNIDALAFDSATSSLTVGITGGTSQTISLAALSTDEQNIDALAFDSATSSLTVGITGGTSQTISLAALSTDEQNIDALAFDSATSSLTVGITGGTSQTISLAALSTDEQNIDALAFDSATSSLTVGITGGTSQTISLAALSTDSQTLAFGSSATTTQTTLEIADGNSLTLQASGSLSFNQTGTNTLELAVTETDASKIIDLDGDTQIQVEEGSDDDTIRFDTAGQERLTIAATGEVRLANPGDFAIPGDSNTAVLGVASATGTHHGRLRLTAGSDETFSDAQGASIDLHGNDATANTGVLDLVAGEAASGTNGAIKFWTNRTGGIGGQQTSALITGEGKMGIGTTTPAETLTVSGTAQITGALYDSSGDAGTAGQVLSSTGTSTNWVDNNTTHFVTQVEFDALDTNNLSSGAQYINTSDSSLNIFQKLPGEDSYQWFTYGGTVNTYNPALFFANIGTDAANGNNSLTSTLTADNLNSLPNVSGAIVGNESAYRAAIAANDPGFSSPATASEVQAMVTAVNNAVSLLANIGTDAANGNNNNTSALTASELNGILGVSGAIVGNESAYRAAIAANDPGFSSPATASEVQAMVTAVNNAASLLANIGTDAANGNNNNTSALTASELNGIPGVSGAIVGNESAYRAAIAANDPALSSPATSAEVQAMVTAVNNAASLLANIGTDAANGNNNNTSALTASELNGIPGVSGAIVGNESAYRAAIAANDPALSSPATSAEVQAMVTAVNSTVSLLANIGTDAANGNNSLTSTLTADNLNSLPNVSGAIVGNESAYRAAIAANDPALSSPATSAEVQAMVTAVNNAASLLANIGTDAANGNNNNTSALTASELNGIPGVSGAIVGNESNYRIAIAANDPTLSSPATSRSSGHGNGSEQYGITIGKYWYGCVQRQQQQYECFDCK